MAGWNLPENTGRDERWLVDRQVYERRRDGVRYVAWSRSRQLGFAWLMALAFVAALAAGVGGTLAWQRYGDEIPAFAQLGRVVEAGAVWLGYEPPPAMVGSESPDADSLPPALADLDSARSRIAVLTAELNGLRDGRGNGPDLVTPAGDTAGEPADLRREVTMLRHERDAAREQIDALMQLTTQMKAELLQPQTGMVSGAALVGAVPPAELEKVLGRVAILESELASARDAGKAAADAAIAERDRARADLAEGQAAMRALQEGHDRLAARGDVVELALAARDDELARLGKQAAAKTEAARILEVDVASLTAERDAARADLDRTRGDRDAALQGERLRREALDAAVARLQAAEVSWATAEDPAAVAAERDRLAARVAELQAEMDDARMRADATGQELARLRADRAGVLSEAEGLRRQLLGGRPVDGAAQVGEGVATASAVATAMPVSASAIPIGGGGPVLQSELAEALARIKELDSRVVASERRNTELERYMGERAPPPSPPAPRRSAD